MSTHTVCTACGHLRDYPSRRGDRIAEMACRVCGAEKSLTRTGSKAGREAMLTHTLTACAIGALTSDHVRLVLWIWSERPARLTDQAVLRELDARGLLVYEPDKRPTLTTTGETLALWLYYVGLSLVMLALDTEALRHAP